MARALRKARARDAALETPIRRRLSGRSPYTWIGCGGLHRSAWGISARIAQLELRSFWRERGYGFFVQIETASPWASNSQWPAFGTTFSVTAKPLPLNAATD